MLLHVLLVKANQALVQTRGCAKATPPKRKPSAPRGHRTTVEDTLAVVLGVCWWLVGGPAMPLYEQGFTPHASSHSTPGPPEVCYPVWWPLSRVRNGWRLANPQAPLGDSGTSRGPGSRPTQSVWPGNCSQLPGPRMGVKKTEAPKGQLAGSPGPQGAKDTQNAPPGPSNVLQGAWGRPPMPSCPPCWSTPAAPPPTDSHTPPAQAPRPRVPPEQHVPGEGCRTVSPAPAGALSLPAGAAGRTSRWGWPGARRGNPSRPGSAGRGHRGPEALWTGRRPDGPAGPATEDGDVSAEPGSGQPCPAVMQDTAVILWGSQGTASTSSHGSPSDQN